MRRKFSRPEKKRLLIAGGLVALVFTAWMLFSPYGAWRHYQLSRELRTMRVENEKLRQENQALEKEIAKLKTDPAYLEEVARKELGLIKKNEMIFDFSKKKRKKK